MTDRMMELPGDDAPIREWLRPVSATLTTRNLNWFAGPTDTKGHGYGALLQRMRKLAKTLKAGATA